MCRWSVERFAKRAITTLQQPLDRLDHAATNLAGIALTAFGQAVIEHDGLLALVAFAATAAGLIVIASQLL
jgi:hypothetical protein